MTTSTPQPPTSPRPVRPWRRAVGLVGRYGLVALILACVAWVTPSFLGFERYVITGGSMSGSIERGAVAFERAVPTAELAVGDVITYLPPAGSGVSNLVTHRIVAIETADDGARVFRTQGDANPDPDPWTFTLRAPTQPVVEFSVPLVGYAFAALADRSVRLLVIGLPAAVIALLALRELVRSLRETRPVEAGPTAEATR